MKVLDVTEFYSERGGGVRSHLTLKAEHLANRGIEHRVIAPGPRDDAVTLFDTRARAAALRVRGPSLPYDPTYHLLWRVGRVKSAISHERPDVLEINSPYVAALASLTAQRRGFGVRTFFWHADFIDTYVRAIAARHVQEVTADMLVRPLWSFVRSIGRGCTATIATSRGQALKLIRHGVPRVVLVPLGVDTAEFRPERRDEALRRTLLGPGAERATLIVGVGRFAMEKNWQLVLDAFARVRKKRELVLVLFGDGPERARLRALADQLGCSRAVRFPGFRSRKELAAALASADLLVHGCAHETFGLSVAEAVASGLPIVVPDAGGAAEVATDCAGASSEIYAAGNVEACAAAIERVLERQPALVREAARAASQRAPSVASHFDRLLALYRELLLAQGAPCPSMSRSTT